MYSTEWAARVNFRAAGAPFLHKAEYLYVDFGNAAYFNPPPAGFINRTGGVPPYEHILRLGLNHTFPAM